MHHCSATVRIKGDLNFGVPKSNVTVAEIALLRLLHGQDAVVDTYLMGVSNRSLRVEKDRLLAAYGAREEIAKAIDAMFQNVAVQPLMTMEDIGLNSKAKRPPPAGSVQAAPPDLEQEHFVPYDPSEDIGPEEEQIDRVPVIGPDLPGAEFVDIGPIPDHAPDPVPDAEPTPEERKAIIAAGRKAAQRGG